MSSLNIKAITDLLTMVNTLDDTNVSPEIWSSSATIRHPMKLQPDDATSGELDALFENDYLTGSAHDKPVYLEMSYFANNQWNSYKFNFSKFLKKLMDMIYQLAMLNTTALTKEKADSYYLHRQDDPTGTEPYVTRALCADCFTAILEITFENNVTFKGHSNTDTVNYEILDDEAEATSLIKFENTTLIESEATSYFKNVVQLQGNINADEDFISDPLLSIHMNVLSTATLSANTIHAFGKIDEDNHFNIHEGVLETMHGIHTNSLTVDDDLIAGDISSDNDISCKNNITCNNLTAYDNIMCDSLTAKIDLSAFTNLCCENIYANKISARTELSTNSLTAENALFVGKGADNVNHFSLRGNTTLYIPEHDIVANNISADSNITCDNLTATADISVHANLRSSNVYASNEMHTNKLSSTTEMYTNNLSANNVWFAGKGTDNVNHFNLKDSTTLYIPGHAIVADSITANGNIDCNAISAKATITAHGNLSSETYIATDGDMRAANLTATSNIQGTSIIAAGRGSTISTDYGSIVTKDGSIIVEGSGNIEIIEAGNLIFGDSTGSTGKIQFGSSSATALYITQGNIEESTPAIEITKLHVPGTGSDTTIAFKAGKTSEFVNARATALTATTSYAGKFVAKQDYAPEDDNTTAFIVTKESGGTTNARVEYSAENGGFKQDSPNITHLTAEAACWS